MANKNVFGKRINFWAPQVYCTLNAYITYSHALVLRDTEILSADEVMVSEGVISPSIKKYVYINQYFISFQNSFPTIEH